MSGTAIADDLVQRASGGLVSFSARGEKNKSSQQGDSSIPRLIPVVSMAGTVSLTTLI
jgi:hypothetical protein